MSLWNKYKTMMHSPYKRTLKSYNLNQGTSFGTCKKASLTIEAAVVIPLLAGYFVMVLFFFSILEIQSAVDEALLYAGRKTAVESSVVDSDELLFLSAEAYMLYALEGEPLIERFVEHGNVGIFLWRSEFREDEIILRADYSVRLPISMFEIGVVSLSSENTFHKWTGDASVEGAEGIVYVTKTGTVYHANLGCRTLDLSVQAGVVADIPALRGKNGQKYYACTRCDWQDEKKERIYYTDYGTLYHKDIACSSLKRTIEKIKKSEVGNRRPCSFCYGV